MTRSEAYRDLFVLICGAPPAVNLPRDLVRLGQLSDDDYFALQTQAASSKLPWLVGIGVLEAMDMMVEEAECNSGLAFERAKPVSP